MTETVSVPQVNNSTIDSIKIDLPEKTIKADPVKENIEKSKNVLTKNEKLIDPVKEKIISVRKEKQINEISEIVIAKTNQVSEKPTSVNAKSVIDQPKEIQILKDSSAVEVDAATRIKDSIEIAAVKIDTAIPKEIEKISDFKIHVENKVQIDSIQKPGSIDSIQKSESKADTMAATKKHPAISKKWKWGVQVTPGISSFVDQFISISTQKSADFAGAPFGGVPAPPATPSNRESGFALQLRGFVQKKISSKTEFAIGLQYSYYSDHIRVGDSRLLIQSASQPQSLFGVSQGYRAANPNISITNSYHFLELPIEFLFQLNKKTAKPFYLNLGITAGQLISSNALVYDTAFGGIYFDGKKQLNKIQFSLSTGFLWTISAKKLQWSVGPVINVHLNRFLDNSFESDKYLLMPGIRTKIIFPGKN